MTTKNDPPHGPTASADPAYEAASPDEQEIQGGLAEVALDLVQTLQAKWDRGERRLRLDPKLAGPWTTCCCMIVHETNPTTFEGVVARGADVIDVADRVRGPAGRAALLVVDVEGLLALEAPGDTQDVEELRRALASGIYAVTVRFTRTLVGVLLVATRAVEPASPAREALQAALERLFGARWRKRCIA